MTVCAAVGFVLTLQVIAIIAVGVIWPGAGAGLAFDGPRASVVR